MVSIRSLTRPFCRIGPGGGRAVRRCLAEWAPCPTDSRDVVPPRPPARRQPGPARRLRHGRRRRAAAVRARPGAVGAGRASPPRPTSRASLRALDASLAAARHGLLASCAATRSARWSCAAREVGRRPGARRRRLRPLRPPPRPRRRAGARRARHRAGAHRVAVRRGAGPGDATAPATPYKVYTPFSRAWAEHGWREPVDAPTGATWLALDDTVGRSPTPPLPAGLELPEAGERPRRCGGGGRTSTSSLADYDDEPRPPRPRRHQPRCRVHLKWGEIHPRTMLADLRGPHRPGRRRPTASELAWREFYADVLFQRPETAREYLRPEFARDAVRRAGRRSSTPGRRAAPASRSSTPGMRQLRATGWMHNRVRMIVASFLVKDLHLEWQHGARHFMQWLVDGDLASNQHGWQWIGRLRHRRGAVLPGLQPDHARARSSTRTAATSGAGCRSSPTCRPKHVHEPAPAPTACRTATPRRSSTTRRSGVEALARYEQDQAMSQPRLVIPARFNGPAAPATAATSSRRRWPSGSPDAGRRAVEVTLRLPPPLDTAADR